MTYNLSAYLTFKIPFVKFVRQFTSYGFVYTNHKLFSLLTLGLEFSNLLSVIDVYCTRTSAGKFAPLSKCIFVERQQLNNSSYFLWDMLAVKFTLFVRLIICNIALIIVFSEDTDIFCYSFDFKDVILNRYFHAKVKHRGICNSLYSIL